MPKLSLAIAAKGQYDAKAFFSALMSQDADLFHATEIVIAHDGNAEIRASAAERITHVAINGANIFQLWGAAVARSHGSYVAILDINSLPHHDWLAEVWRAIESGGSAYHGAVDARYGPGDVRVIGYLVEYVQFYPPIAKDMAEIPGNNLVVRRDVLPSANALKRDGFSKTYLLARLKDARRIEAAVVEHRKPFDALAYIARRYRHGRCYGASRVEASGLLERIRLAALTPLLPFVRVNRIRWHVKRVPLYRSSFIRFLPVILAAEAGWSWGEFRGYLSGSGGCERSLD